MIAIEGIRSRNNRQGLQRLCRFVRSSLGIKDCRNVAFAGQRHYYLQVRALARAEKMQTKSAGPLKGWFFAELS